MRLTEMLKRLTVFVSLAGICPWAMAALVVVGNPSVPVSKLSDDQVARIYLCKTRSWPDGSIVIPVDQAQGSPAYQKFYADVVRKTDSELKSYWSQIIFTGKGQPPQEEGSGQQVKELVAQNPSFIGYIDSSLVDHTVKILMSVE